MYIYIYSNSFMQLDIIKLIHVDASAFTYFPTYAI